MYHDKNSNQATASSALTSRRIKNRGNLLIWGFVLVVLAAIAVGDVPSGRGSPAVPGEQGPLMARADQATASSALTSENIKATKTKVSRSKAAFSVDEPIQSITFKKDMQIRDALRFLAAKYQKNIVPSSKVDGVITITSLYDVTFAEALDAILGYGFKYDEEGNFIKVYTAEEYKKIKEDKDRMIHKVFTLYYISAAEAMKLVSPVLSGAGIIQGSSPAGVGISTGKEGATGEAGGDSMALNDYVVIYDYPENIAKAEELITSIDIRPKQVLVEATILSADLTEGMELGVDLSLLGGISLDGLSTEEAAVGVSEYKQKRNYTLAKNPLEQIVGLIPSATAIETFGFSGTESGGGLKIGVTVGNVSAFITALESVTDITVLANPKILALNKQAGTVFIGKKIGYRDRTTIDASGQATVGEVKFLDTGTKLSFRPYIADDGYIRMDIYPKDSSGELDDLGIPTETTAELTTNIMVKDGQTIVIGGLFRDAVTTTRSQVPLLGDLPFIGAAFRKTNDDSKRQEVIVLLTPHIIERAEQTDGKARADDIARKRFGVKDGLQWTGKARLAADRYAKAAKHYIEGNNKAALREVKSALELRPTYLEALRLKERIIGEIDPEKAAKMERIILSDIDKKESSKWLRR